MAGATRKSVIVTFKPKDQRPDRTQDKVDILRAAITSQENVTFFNAVTLPRGAALPADLPRERVGYDVNQYEAPMVAASLTDAEISTLRGNANVAAVEEDAPCYVLGASQGPGHLVIADQPSPQAETVPAGVTQIKAPAAWDASRGKAIKVAVLGMGIDSTHPDLAPNYKGGISFVPSENQLHGFQWPGYPLCRHNRGSHQRCWGRWGGAGGLSVCRQGARSIRQWAV